ncbi:MAG: hypothetical protein H6742_11110 [Alphaproteobacteria bacterium]|nr:hypothetical protein [Alphaproteobacteria bacterium]
MRSPPPLLLLALPLASLVAAMGCTDAARGPAVVHDGEGFFGSPFPSDARTVDGHPDMTGFPGREDFDLIDLYCEEIEKLDGFGTNAAVWLPLDRALDTSILPDAFDSTGPDSPILLLDVDPTSPLRGTAVPWTWTWQDNYAEYIDKNVLAIQPLWGAVLRPSRRYAVLLRTSGFRARPGLADVWEADHPDHAEYQSLQEVLFQLDIPLEDVADVVQFRTQDPVGRLAKWVDHSRSAVSLPALDQAVFPTLSGSYFQAYQGELLLPQWQEGSPPFLTEGGDFVEDDAGVPVLARWQQVSFSVSVPTIGEMPPDGWPVVVYAHGTGGTHQTFISGTGPKTPASVLARNGIVGIGISMPLHGERGSGADPEILSFNFFNPPAALGNFQQAALDHLYLIETLASYDTELTLLDRDGQPDGSLRLDPSRIAWLGHSHGGVVGAMAAPYLDGRVDAVFLSGAGGGISLAVQYREQGGLDIEDILRRTFELDQDEALVPTHPLLAMVQVLAEGVDPLNYAPYWQSRQPFWNSQPVSVLMTTGLLDQHTPSLTSQILAGSAGLPIAAPTWEAQPINELVGIEASLPLRGNRTAWDGSAVTGGIVEFPDDDHYPIFNNSDAIALYGEYLRSALYDGAPTITDRD